MLLCCLPFLAEAAVVRVPVMLGTSKVLVEYQRGTGLTFVHVHADEKTALVAAQRVARRTGAGLLRLVHPGGRLVCFQLKGKRYLFDPNRMFSDSGIRQTLTRYSQYSPDAHRAIAHLANVFLKHLPPGKVVSVHNNRGYSMRDYFPGHPSAREAAAIHQNPNWTYRNFYFVTQREDYARMRKLGFNSVLQARTPSDDGSLSVRLSGAPYINVEAAHGQLQQQISMLENA